VERSVDRRPGRELLCRQPLHHVSSERVVSQLRGKTLEVRKRRSRRFTVSLDRGRLAVPKLAFVPDLDLNNVGCVP
jgi:hypothetical protein